MSDGFPDNDRDFNARLDQAVPSHIQPRGTPDADPLIHLAQRLAQRPDALFSDAALDRIEARLNAQMDTMKLYSAPSTPRQRRGQFGRLVRYAAAAALALIVVVATVTQAAAGSLPGDRLYPVKRAVEDIRVALATEDGEAALRLALAERRIDEFEALLEQGRVYPGALEEANDEIGHVLNLLAAGHGDWADVDLRFHSLMIRDTFLLDQATRHAEAAERVRLDGVAARSIMLQARFETLVPILSPTMPDGSPTMISTLSPTTQPTMGVSPTPTPTQFVTATRVVTRTPTITLSPSLTVSPTPSPTIMSTRRAPTSTSSPGSGDTSGSPNGNQTPVQGGANSGAGGQPEDVTASQGGNPAPGQAGEGLGTGEKPEETSSDQGGNPSQGNGK